MIRTLLFLATIYFVIGCSRNRTNVDSEQIPKDIEEQLAISMEAYKQTKSDLKLTSKTIEAISDDSLLFVVTEDLKKKLPKEESHFEEINSWNISKQAVFIVGQLSSEVVERGFNEYYLMTDGKFNDELPKLLKLIGATEYADLTIKANEIYKSESLLFTDNSKASDKTTRTYPVKNLYPLDKEFKELNKTEDLQRLLTAYIRNNPKEFTDD